MGTSANNGIEIENSAPSCQPPPFQSPVAPHILNPLFAGTTSLPGVGKHVARLLEKLAGPTVGRPAVASADRADRPAPHAPRWPRRRRAPSSPWRSRLTATCPAAGRATPTRCAARTTPGSSTWCSSTPAPTTWPSSCRSGSQRIVSGRIELFNDEAQITHPTTSCRSGADTVIGVEPTYPLTAGLTPRPLKKANRRRAARAPSCPNGTTRR